MFHQLFHVTISSVRVVSPALSFQKSIKHVGVLLTESYVHFVKTLIITWVEKDRVLLDFLESWKLHSECKWVKNSLEMIVDKIRFISAAACGRCHLSVLH